MLQTGPAFAWDWHPQELNSPQDCLIFPAVLLIFAVFRYEYFVWQNNQNERIIMRNGLKKTKKKVRICYSYCNKWRKYQLLFITLKCLNSILVGLNKFILCGIKKKFIVCFYSVSEFIGLSLNNYEYLVQDLKIVIFRHLCGYQRKRSWMS